MLWALRLALPDEAKESAMQAVILGLWWKIGILSEGNWKEGRNAFFQRIREANINQSDLTNAKSSKGKGTKEKIHKQEWNKWQKEED